jgi:NADH dehydrogenase
MALGRSIVFGGTGFLGQQIVQRLLAEGDEVRAASRRAANTGMALQADHPRLVRVRASIGDEAAIAAAIRQCFAVVNAVALYVEKGDATFQTVHADGAERLAKLASEAGVPRLIHISGIGADLLSESRYVRARAEGEARVTAAFPSATIMRPSVLFGPGDAFFNMLARVTRFVPVIPLFGAGTVRLQPVYVADVAEAAARALKDPDTKGKVFELGGPQSYSYRSLVGFVLKQTGRRRIMLPVPFALWDALALLGSVLPQPPITQAQVALMKKDNLADAKYGTFQDLGVKPRSIEEIVPAYLSSLAV